MSSARSPRAEQLDVVVGLVRSLAELASTTACDRVRFSSSMSSRAPCIGCTSSISARNSVLFSVERMSSLFCSSNSGLVSDPVTSSIASHPDVTGDTPRSAGIRCLLCGTRREPRDGVLVVGVDERSVDVEQIAAAPTGPTYPVGRGGSSSLLLDVAELLQVGLGGRLGLLLVESTRALSSCMTSRVRLPCTDSIVAWKSGPASSTTDWLATKTGFPAGNTPGRPRGSRTCRDGEQLRVGREQDRQVRVAVVQDLVAQGDVDRLELRELEPVASWRPTRQSMRWRHSGEP